MALTVNEIYTQLNYKTNNKFSAMSNDVKLNMLNEAIVNQFEAIKLHYRQAVEAKSTLTFSSEVETVALPSDFNYGECDWALFSEDTYSYDALEGGKDLEFRVDGTNLRFDYKQPAGQGYYLRYIKEPNAYTAVETDVTETGSERVKQILFNEIESIFESRRLQGQISPAAQASRFKANNLV